MNISYKGTETIKIIVSDFYEILKYIYSKEEYNNLISQIINEAEKEYSEVSKQRKLVKNLLSKEVEITVKNKVKITKLIMNFIEKQLKNPNNYSDANTNLSTLVSFFESFGYIPELDIMTEIINNSEIISNSLDLIQKENNNEYGNNIIELLMDAYCLENGIEVEEDEIFNETSNEVDPEDLIKLYFNDIRNISVLTKEEEYLLFTRLKYGDQDAKKKIIEHNLKLVVSVSKKYVNSINKLSQLDLIQDGNFGLIKAVDKFDMSKGYRFSSFAVWWIRKEIVSGIRSNDRSIKIPFHMQDKLKDYDKKINELSDKLHRRPTNSEVSTETGFSISLIQEFEKYRYDTASIDIKVNDEDSELSEFIPSKNNFIEDIILSEDFSKYMHVILDKIKFTEREKEVLYLRYGLNGNLPAKLDDIAALLGVTHQAVHQAQKKALTKIACSNEVLNLLMYCDNQQNALQHIKEIKIKQNEKWKKKRLEV